MYGRCVPVKRETLEEKQKFAADSMNLMRKLFNGSKVTFENQVFNLKDTITKHYGDTDSPLGKKMFEEIVWNATRKPAFDSFTGFTDGDIRRIKNYIVKESKNLNNPKLSWMERHMFVRRGVMQKYAVTNYMNKGINFQANYERNAFSNYLDKHIKISELIRTEIFRRTGRTKLIPHVKEVNDLQKLENKLVLEINNPSSDLKGARVSAIVGEMQKILSSRGGEVLKEIVEYLETPKPEKGERMRIDPESGREIPFERNVERAGEQARELLDDMGKVLISGLEAHKDVIRNAYLNSTDKSALLTRTGQRVQRYEKVINEEIKAIKKGMEGGDYFPHYLVESFLTIENVMNRAEKEQYKNSEKDLNELEQIVTEMRSSLGTPKSARFRGSTPSDLFLSSPLTVLRKYSLDAIAFNKSNYLKNLYYNGMRGMPKEGEAAAALEKYLSDTFQLAGKGYSDRPDWVNKTVRTLTGFQFLSKLGFGVGTAARNTLSGMYYIQSVGNRNFARYLREWENHPLRDTVRDVEKEQGFKFEDMASPLFTEGLLPTEGIKQRQVEIKEVDGNHVLQYKEGKIWRTFDAALTKATGTGAIFQRVTENFLRRHMFRYSFIEKYNELRDGGLTDTKSKQKATKHAVDVVGKYAFEYAASQKAPMVGGSQTGLGAAGQIAFQFMHYPMSFLQLQSDVLRKSWDAGIARQWNSPDLIVPLRFAGLYLFTELMSGVLNLDLHRMMENDTVERIQTLKKALEGEDVKGRGFMGPTVGDLYFYATMLDFIKTPDNAIADIIVGYNDAYEMTTDQQKARALSTLNVQLSKLITKDYKALSNGTGWDLLMHEFGLYPTKRTRELRKKEPLRTIFPSKKKKEGTDVVAKASREQQEELTKLYRAMGI
tara:strand:+ start:7082 stop:9739 length:2658 start_codon:yes stop_codon:yes gene_type:complete